MESLVREMQDPENGVPVRSQKLFLTSIPSAFMGEYIIVTGKCHLTHSMRAMKRTYIMIVRYHVRQCAGE